jgi:hypothetical protein
MRAQKQKATVDPITSAIIIVSHKGIAESTSKPVDEFLYVQTEICFDLGWRLAFLFPAPRHLMPNTGHFQV